MTIGDVLKKRTFDFAVAVFRLTRTLGRAPDGRTPCGQLVRASSGSAANYRAACRARSTREFIAKLGIVIEETDESLFWLEFLVATKLAEEQEVLSLKMEANELVAIFTASQKTARANAGRRKEKAAAR